jgi:hypothetical protein
MIVSASSFAVAQNHMTASHAVGAMRMLLTTGQPAPPPEVPSPEAPFLAENDVAMTKMMTDMAIKPTGDVDRDFVEMMVPHHQGAIDMAQAELRHGHNEQLRRLAQEIIVTQQQEIAAMCLAIGEPLPPSVPSPTQPAPARPTDHDASVSSAASNDAMSHHSTNMK